MYYFLGAGLMGVSLSLLATSLLLIPHGGFYNGRVACILDDVQIMLSYIKHDRQ